MDKSDQKVVQLLAKPMTCRWVFLPSIEYPMRLCGKPGHPYCEEHKSLLEEFERDLDEFLATHRSVSEEPKQERLLFVVHKSRLR